MTNQNRNNSTPNDNDLDDSLDYVGIKELFEYNEMESHETEFNETDYVGVRELFESNETESNEVAGEKGNKSNEESKCKRQKEGGSSIKNNVSSKDPSKALVSDSDRDSDSGSDTDYEKPRPLPPRYPGIRYPGGEEARKKEEEKIMERIDREEREREREERETYRRMLEELPETDDNFVTGPHNRLPKFSLSYKEIVANSLYWREYYRRSSGIDSDNDNTNNNNNNNNNSNDNDDNNSYPLHFVSRVRAIYPGIRRERSRSRQEEMSDMNNNNNNNNNNDNNNNNNNTLNCQI
jgi:hypothetical protein